MIAVIFKYLIFILLFLFLFLAFYFRLSELAKKLPYSAKYLNLLIRQGKLEAHKEGRNWVSSDDAVSRYIENRERKRRIS